MGGSPKGRLRCRAPMWAGPRGPPLVWGVDVGMNLVILSRSFPGPASHLSAAVPSLCLVLCPLFSRYRPLALGVSLSPGRSPVAGPVLSWSLLRPPCLARPSISVLLVGVHSSALAPALALALSVGLSPLPTPHCPPSLPSLCPLSSLFSCPSRLLPPATKCVSGLSPLLSAFCVCPVCVCLCLPSVFVTICLSSLSTCLSLSLPVVSART